ncbi:hypothetical protein [Chitinophaga sp. RAB17]|uniref:hypothetical protein n=1 Tax=Chitinophaga sp. RAB17 TaxID=3233049 RepID=UPI003F90F38A
METKHAFGKSLNRNDLRAINGGEAADISCSLFNADCVPPYGPSGPNGNNCGYAGPSNLNCFCAYAGSCQPNRW